MDSEKKNENDRLTSSAIERFARVEHQLATAQKITHIGSWDWRITTDKVTWSDELYRIYGLEPQSVEVTFPTFLSRVHPEDRERIQGEVGAALQRGGRFAYQERVVRPDGSIRYLDTIGEVTVNRDGEKTGLIGTCRDLTDDRKRDEEMRRYADIVRNVQLSLTVWKVERPDDPSTFTLAAYNPASVRIARMPLEAHLGATMNEILPYARGGQLQALIAEVARDGEVRETTVLSSRDIRDPTRAVSIKAFPLPEKHVGVAIEDITAQTVTRKLQEAEQHVLEMLAEGAPLATVLSSLILAIEAHSPPTIGAIHLRDPDGTRYPERVAPSLRISTDELHVYAAAPVLATDERDLGDFVLYVREQKRVVEDDVKVLERAANLARIAIERRQLEDQLRELSAHAESVREDERTGIAREIHDQLGQSLTALKMDIAWIVRRSQAGELESPALIEKLAGMSKMTDEIIQQVRRISAELRPGVLDDLGLVAAIEWQAQEFEARTGTACTVRASSTVPALDRSTSTAVFRILQEALTNVTRHAEAKHVVVNLEAADGSLVLEVQDDGKGISPEAARGRKSLGLLGIRERALRLGGSVSVTATAPRGTLLSLRVPLARAGAGVGGGGGVAR